MVVIYIHHSQMSAMTHKHRRASECRAALLVAASDSLIKNVYRSKRGIHPLIFVVVVVIINWSSSKSKTEVDRKNLMNIQLYFLYHLVFLINIPGLAGVRRVEVVQQSDAGGGAGGVPIHPDALHPAAHPAAPAAASLLLYQLLSRRAPRRNPPHRSCGLLPCPR